MSFTPPPPRPTKSYGVLSNGARPGPAWTPAASSHTTPSSPTPGFGFGFFGNGFRKLSRSILPGPNRPAERKYSDREKLLRGRMPALQKLRNLSMLMWRHIYLWRRPLIVIFTILMAYVLFYTTPLHRMYRRTYGGGSKFVLILAANEGGGVMEWKGPREWAIERDSVRNKKKYSARWGYNLEIVDMVTRKRYAHEWRESWEKVDTFRRVLKDYPDAEWFWWLDLHTFIMEPQISLQTLIFDDLAASTYRDINEYNPLNISHPPTDVHLDAQSRSAVGDNDPASIHLLVPQDCDGFNLGSFFVRRGPWLDRLLDLWWDPVQYEQRHMQWVHKEQDALEHLYIHQPWIRAHTAFLPQRTACSFPPGACGQGGNPHIHYDEKDRDFMVNMAGCEWGRDCWGEMYTYRELSNWLNRSPLQRCKDGLKEGASAVWRFVTRTQKKPPKQKQKTASGLKMEIE